MASIEERQANRLRMLLEVYNMTDGDKFKRVNYRQIAAQLGLDDPEAVNAAQYLVDEGLLQWAALGGTIAIEHRGVKEAEAVLLGHSTPHFGTGVVNIISISDSTVGDIQQGTADSQQGPT